MYRCQYYLHWPLNMSRTFGSIHHNMFLLGNELRRKKRKLLVFFVYLPFYWHLKQCSYSIPGNILKTSLHFEKKNDLTFSAHNVPGRAQSSQRQRRSARVGDLDARPLSLEDGVAELQSVSWRRCVAYLSAPFSCTEIGMRATAA